MAQVILTLFGEEIVPEPVKPEPKPRAPKKEKEARKKTEEPDSLEEPVAVADVVTHGPEEQSFAEVRDDQPANDEGLVEKPVKAQAPARSRKPKAALPSADELLKEFDGQKQYYAIGEVARLFKVNTSHIRFWTNEFKLKVRTTRKGDRLYTPEQIKELKAIYHLVKERGYTIAGAKTKLKEKRKTTIESVSLKESLLQLRDKLTQIKKELKG